MMAPSGARRRPRRAWTGPRTETPRRHHVDASPAKNPGAGSQNPFKHWIDFGNPRPGFLLTSTLEWSVRSNASRPVGNKSLAAPVPLNIAPSVGCVWRQTHIDLCDSRESFAPKGHEVPEHSINTDDALSSTLPRLATSVSFVQRVDPTRDSNRRGRPS